MLLESDKEIKTAVVLNSDIATPNTRGYQKINMSVPELEGTPNHTDKGTPNKGNPVDKVDNLTTPKTNLV